MQLHEHLRGVDACLILDQFGEFITCPIQEGDGAGGRRACGGEIIKALLPGAFLFEGADEPLAQPVLLGREGSNIFLREAVWVGVQTRPISSMNGRIEALSAFTQAESLVIHPASITQASLLNDIRAAVSVSIAHFSVCIEHVEDICEDIDQALKG